jgi:hypothetical protein
LSSFAQPFEQPAEHVTGAETERAEMVEIDAPEEPKARAAESGN